MDSTYAKQANTLISAGIDIGTTTTQVLFSRLSLTSDEPFGKIPDIRISKKDILYQSPIWLTPLSEEGNIDAICLKKYICKAYSEANLLPQDIDTGAVIITGESSAKRNACQVIDSIADYAGNFIAVSAGPDLESLLAGKGAGADQLSLNTGKLVAHLDIGGGTTNICYFKNGHLLDTGCLDIGGRLIRIVDDYITYIAPKLPFLMTEKKIRLSVGDYVKDPFVRKNLDKLVDAFLLLIEESIGLRASTNLLDLMKTHHLPNLEEKPNLISFSGGVSSCSLVNDQEDFLYGDIGVLLGRALASSIISSSKYQVNTSDTITYKPESLQATVIGASQYSVRLSGSTISYNQFPFPQKSIPIYHTKNNKKPFNARHSTSLIPYAFCLDIPENPDVETIESMADDLMESIPIFLSHSSPILVLFEADAAKAFGQALKRRLPPNYPFLCLDSLRCQPGDYIDIGDPIAGGQIIPVTIRSLVFNHTPYS